MKNQILVISNNQKAIDFSILKAFYPELTKVSKVLGTKEELRHMVIKTSLTIIDVDSLQQVDDIMNRINEYDPSMSYLLIQSFDTKLNQDLVVVNKGYGQVSVLNYRNEYPEVLIESVNRLIHPEYPVGASDIAVILPVFNEESRFHNVRSFYQKLERLCNDSFVNAVIYFVNDGSSDNTQKMVEQIIIKLKSETNTLSNVSFVNSHELVLNTRKAGTYIDGIKTIRADVLLFVDADDSFRIEDMAKMINIVREGYYELVVGTKDLTAENRPLIRRLMSFVKRQLTKSLLPVGVYDSQTGLKAINGTAAKYILPHLNVSTGLAIDLEILHIASKYKFRTLQIPVHCIDQEGSHINVVKDSIQFIKNIFAIKLRHKHVGRTK